MNLLKPIQALICSIQDKFISTRPYILLPLSVILIGYVFSIIVRHNFVMNSISWTSTLIIFGFGSILCLTSIIDLDRINKPSTSIRRILIIVWFIFSFPVAIYICYKGGETEQKEKALFEINLIKQEKVKKQKFVDSILMENGCKR